MCNTALFESRVCRCRWLQIEQQCGCGMGFSTCPNIDNGLCKPPIKRYECDYCPVHYFGGFYDRNSIRMLVKLERGIKFGGGVHRTDPGCEIKCVIM